MTVPFKQIPSTLRVPLFYAEVDPSRANTSGFPQRALIIGQITAPGAAAPNVPIVSQGVADAKTQGGPGSMLALMTAAYRANDPFGEVWYLPVADAGGATAATGTIVIAGPATAAGSLAVYIAGQLVTVPVTSGEASTAIATALYTAINANPDLPVTAAITTSTVTLTAKNKGLNGNDIDVRVNYRGAAGGETLPAGVGVTITAMASGATNPTLSTALANLLDMPFDFIISPYTDATSIAALTALLNDSAGRWAWTSQVYGHVFIANRGTFSGQTTFGTGLNDQHTSCMGFNDSPTPNWVWAAAYAAAAAVSLKADPATPLQTVVINGVLAPPLASRFSLSQRNTLLFDGISTFNVDQSGVVRIENVITTYQLNAFNQPDNSYLQVETLFTLMFVLRALAGVVTTKYARVKLADDGTRFNPGSNVVTPAIVRGDLIAQYRQLEAAGLVEDAATFAQGLIVQRNATNPSRLDVLYPANLISALRVFALLAQFRL